MQNSTNALDEQLVTKFEKKKKLVNDLKHKVDWVIQLGVAVPRPVGPDRGWGLAFGLGRSHE